MFNAEVLFREDASADEFIDVIQGNRIYMPCLYVSGFCAWKPLLKHETVSFDFALGREDIDALVSD